MFGKEVILTCSLSWFSDTNYLIIFQCFTFYNGLQLHGIAMVKISKCEYSLKVCHMWLPSVNCVVVRYYSKCIANCSRFSTNF